MRRNSGPRLNLFSGPGEETNPYIDPHNVPSFLTEIGPRLAERQLGHVDRVGPVRQRELDRVIVELLHVWATALVVGHLFNANDLQIRRIRLRYNDLVSKLT